jgi:hypothetical protein
MRFRLGISRLDPLVGTPFSVCIDSLSDMPNVRFTLAGSLGPEHPCLTAALTNLEMDWRDLGMDRKIAVSTLAAGVQVHLTLL